MDNVQVRVLPTVMARDRTEAFDAGRGELVGPGAGTWTTSGGRLLTTPPTGASAVTTVALPGGLAVDVNAVLELTTTVRTTGLAGLVFDRYADDDYKFAAIDVAGARVVIGHHAPGSGWRSDSAVTWTFAPAADITMTAVLKGASISLTVGGQLALSRGFNAPLVDGGFGLLARLAAASFDLFRYRTNDVRLATTTTTTSSTAATTTSTGTSTSTSTSGGTTALSADPTRATTVELASTTVTSTATTDASSNITVLDMPTVGAVSRGNGRN